MLVDPNWAAEYLLPLFDWNSSSIEARAAWEGFLWSPRIYRPLMLKIKPQFLATAHHYNELGKKGDQYSACLTFAALEPGDTFTKHELAAATRALPADGLLSASKALVRALTGAGEQRAEYWRNRILPYFKSIWPKSREVLTPAISESIARLCVTAQDSFPEAFQELRSWVQPSEHPHSVLYLLNESKLCERFPEHSLEFLERVISENTQWPPHNLEPCLDAVKRAQPDLEGDNRFQKLNNYLRRFHHAQAH